MLIHFGKFPLLNTINILEAYLYSSDGVLLSGECDEGAALALTSLIPEHCALLDGSVAREELPHIGLGVLFVQHANEKFTFWKYISGKWEMKECFLVKAYRK